MSSEEPAEITGREQSRDIASSTPESAPMRRLTAEERKARQAAARAAWRAKPLAVKIKAYLVMGVFALPMIVALLVGLMTVVIPRPLVSLSVWAEPVTGALVGLIHQPLVEMRQPGVGQGSLGQPANIAPQIDIAGSSPWHLDIGASSIYPRQSTATLLDPVTWYNRRDLLSAERRDVDDLVISADMISVSLVMTPLVFFVVLAPLLVVLRRNRPSKKPLSFSFYSGDRSRAARARRIALAICVSALLLGLGGYCLYDAFYTGDLFWSEEMTRHGQIRGLDHS